MNNLTDALVPKTEKINKFRTLIRKIIPISKNNIENIEVLDKKEEILDKIWKSFLDKPEKMTKGLMTVVKSIIKQGYPDYRFEDTEIEDLLNDRVKKLISGETGKDTLSETQMKSIISGNRGARKMKIKGDTIKFHFFYEILVNTAEWLIKNGKLNPSDYPVELGSRRNLINNEPKHKNGIDFRSSRKLSNGLWIEVRLTKKCSINSAKMLLEKFGFPSDILIIK